MKRLATIELIQSGSLSGDQFSIARVIETYLFRSTLGIASVGCSLVLIWKFSAQNGEGVWGQFVG